MKYDIITIGGATRDITFYTNEGVLIDNKKDVLRSKILGFEYGSKVKVSKAYNTFGGGAANSAVCLSLLGFKVASFVAVGKDVRGKKIIQNFKKHKIETRFIQKSDTEESSFSFIVASSKYGNEHVIFSYRGANEQLVLANYEEAVVGEERVLKIFNQAKWIYLTSLSGKVSHWKRNLSTVFKSNGPNIAWNPGGRQIASGVRVIGKYLKKTCVLILNKDEALELVLTNPKLKRKTKVYLNNIKNLLKILYEFGPSIIVITCGAKGAYVYDGKNNYYQPAAKEKKRVDTTGVGDAFGSTFIAGLNIYDGNTKKALKLSARNTASVIEKVGAQNGLVSV